MKFDVGSRNFHPFRRIGNRAILANNDYSISFGSEIKSESMVVMCGFSLSPNRSLLVYKKSYHKRDSGESTSSLP